MGKIILKRKTYSLTNLAKGLGGGYLLYDVFKNGKDQDLTKKLLKSGLGIGLLGSALNNGQNRNNLASILGTLAIGGVLYNRVKNNKKPNEMDNQEDTISSITPQENLTVEKPTIEVSSPVKKDDTKVEPVISPMNSQKDNKVDPIPFDNKVEDIDNKEKSFSIKLNRKKKY